jgi:predicted metal-dependent phosphoesterase TrpH
MSGADLHLHSTASDGLFSPREVVRRAFGVGLAALALTDHDTLAGIDEAGREARRLGIVFLPGCEVSVAWEGHDIHVLAYGVAAEQGPLPALLAETARARDDRMRAMLGHLARLGIELREDEVRAHGRSTHATGRMHVARALVSGGHAHSCGEAFGRWIGRAGPAYVPKQTRPLDEILAAIWMGGGVPVLAHPGGYGVDGLEAWCVGWDLGGIETRHPCHSSETEARLTAIARDRGWVATGGSDWHGDEHAENGIGCRLVVEGIVDEILARRRA